MIKLLNLFGEESKKLKLEKFLKNNNYKIMQFTEKNEMELIFILEQDADLSEKIFPEEIPKEANITANSFLQKIVALKENRKILLNVNCILYFFYEDSSVKIVTDDNSVYRVNHSLDYWQKRFFSNSFIRCQKGYLVNMNKVIEIIPYFKYTLGLKFKENNKIIPVGRKYMRELKYTIGW